MGNYNFLMFGFKTRLIGFIITMISGAIYVYRPIGILSYLVAVGIAIMMLGGPE